MPAVRPTRQDWPWPAFLLLLLVELWAAHAFAFFPHEYAHAVTAWLLGWKLSPFALHVPPLSPTVLLIQLGINQGVNEAPIFAFGHGPQAALIAAAGMVVGNALITYPLSRLGFFLAHRRGGRAWPMFFFLTTVANLGNLLDYVPIRTFTTESDMGSVERGFGWSPWLLLAVFGIPSLLLFLDFFLRFEPRALAFLFPASPGRRTLLAFVAAAALFGFYGSAGLLEGGPISHRLSELSLAVALPLTAILGAVRVQRFCTTLPALAPSATLNP